jgi:hypothetical protein
MQDLDLAKENNPLLFGATLSVGRIEFDLKVVSCHVALKHSGDGDPSPRLVVEAMRAHCEPKEVAGQADEVEMFTAFMRASERMVALGKTTGSAPGSLRHTAGSQANSRMMQPQG